MRSPADNKPPKAKSIHNNELMSNLASRSSEHDHENNEDINNNSGTLDPGDAVGGDGGIDQSPSKNRSTQSTPTHARPPSGSPRTPQKRYVLQTNSPRVSTLMAHSPRKAFSSETSTAFLDPATSNDSDNKVNENEFDELFVQEMCKKLELSPRSQKHFCKSAGKSKNEKSEFDSTIFDLIKIYSSEVKKKCINFDLIPDNNSLLATPKKNAFFQRDGKSKSERKQFELRKRYQANSPRSPKLCKNNKNSPEDYQPFIISKLCLDTDSSPPGKVVDKFCEKFADSPITKISASSSSKIALIPLKRAGVVAVRSKAFEEACKSKQKEVSKPKIPPFFFRFGCAIPAEKNVGILKEIEKIFVANMNQIDLSKMAEVCTTAQLPICWKRPLYDCCTFKSTDCIPFNKFAIWWRRFTANAHDEAAKFVYILTNGTRQYLIEQDFETFIQDMIDTMPSLSFLVEATKFHKSYINTVICRIFWSVNRSWSGRITMNELRRSKLLKAMKSLDNIDVNEESDFFSYEHFYVVYCKFFHINPDKNDCLSKSNLAQYAGGALTDIVIKRIFSGVVSRSIIKRQVEVEKIEYTDFVYFILAEIDKSHPTSIEYWFRVMDLNGDGRLSLDELECFYSEIVNKVLDVDIETISFCNIINLLRDLVQPKSLMFFTLSDLKKSLKVSYFFNTFINWIKHHMQEADASALKYEENNEMSDWDLYCAIEHSNLIGEACDGYEL